MNENIIELPLDVELLPIRELTAGKIVCTYEKGFLRYIRFGDEELVRMIYVAVRDEHWDTADYEIEDQFIEQTNNSFLINYTAIYSFDTKVYSAKVRIEGKANGEINFSFAGEAKNTFLSNRIGICVLHPLNCAGKEVEILEPDGNVNNGLFPESVGPHQPFINIAGMRWSPVDGVTVGLTFEGDIFETEDQRNWGDSSFKTYGTPLANPFPVSVKAGDRKKQNVSFSIHVDERIQSQKTKNNNSSENRLPFPKLGFSSSNPPAALKEILIHHYYITIDITNRTWTDEWRNAVKQAKEINVRIVCVLNGADNNEISKLLDELSAAANMLYSILFIPDKGNITDRDWLHSHIDEIRTKLPGALIEFGSTSYFAELNRSRPTNQQIDLLSFPINPQAHLTDYRTMVDNLGSQLSVLKSIETFAPRKKVRVGPISFTPSIKGLRNTNFAAWWILACIGKSAGAEAIAIGEINEASPLYKILRELKQFNPVWVIQNEKKDFDSELTVENDKSERLTVRLNYFV